MLPVKESKAGQRLCHRMAALPGRLKRSTVGAVIQHCHRQGTDGICQPGVQLHLLNLVPTRETTCLSKSNFLFSPSSPRPSSHSLLYTCLESYLSSRPHNRPSLHPRPPVSFSFPVLHRQTLLQTAPNVWFSPPQTPLQPDLMKVTTLLGSC